MMSGPALLLNKSKKKCTEQGSCTWVRSGGTYSSSQSLCTCILERHAVTVCMLQLETHNATRCSLCTLIVSWHQM